MTRSVGGERLPSTASRQELQAAQQPDPTQKPLAEGACQDCRGRGHLSASCVCTQGRRRTAATATCPHCGGTGIVHTTCFTCDGSGTVAGARAAARQRDREAQWARDQHDRIMTAINRLR